MKKSLLVLALSTFALGACVTDPTTGQQKISKTAVYGASAAAVCGVIGAISHGGKGARNSALACGAVGAGVGAYMDYQEKKLREQLAGTGVEVERQGNQIKLTMPENITFATNSYVLSQTARNSLAQAAQTLATYADTTITVIGHTDSTGNDTINIPLSHKRAGAVADYLRQHGVAASRMSVSGKGSSQPIADNGSEFGRAQNRRVEILINPKPNAGM